MLTNPFGETYGGFFRYRYYPDPDTGENYDWNGDGVITDADALLQQYRGNFNDPNLATATTYHSFYVQDAWKITDRITLKAASATTTSRWPAAATSPSPMSSPATGLRALV